MFTKNLPKTLPFLVRAVLVNKHGKLPDLLSAKTSCQKKNTLIRSKN